MRTASRPLKLFGECYPNNAWYEARENGTFFGGLDYYKLWYYRDRFQHGIEIVANVSTTPSEIHPVVSPAGCSLLLSEFLLRIRLMLGEFLSLDYILGSDCG